MFAWEELRRFLTLRPWLLVQLLLVLAALPTAAVLITRMIDRWLLRRRQFEFFPDIAQAEIRGLQGENRSLRRWIRRLETAEREKAGLLHGIRTLAGQGEGQPSLEEIEDELDVELREAAR